MGRIKGYSGHLMPQMEEELQGLIRIAQRRGVRHYLEIGLRWGDSFYAIGSQLPEGSVLVGVDRQAAPGHATAQHRAERDLVRQGKNVTLVTGDSQSPAVVDLVERHGPYDLVFIDGDHSLCGVCLDWSNYGDMAPIVAFHDIVAERLEVKTLWSVLKEQHFYVELVTDGSPMGIGVVFK